MTANTVTVTAIPDCDICRDRGERVPAVFDAKTVHGPWANLCQSDFDEYGIKLGTGFGQRLVLADTKPRCPRCGSDRIIDGFQCTGCGADISDLEESTS